MESNEAFGRSYSQKIMIIQRLLLTAWIKINCIRFARIIVQISTFLGPICHSLGRIIQREFVGPGIAVDPWYQMVV